MFHFRSYFPKYDFLCTYKQNRVEEKEDNLLRINSIDTLDLKQKNSQIFYVDF